MYPGCKVQTGKHGFLVSLLKKDQLMVVGDEWWRKRAVVLIDFGQIETLVAFWRWEIGSTSISSNRKYVGLD